MFAGGLAKRPVLGLALTMVVLGGCARTPSPPPQAESPAALPPPVASDLSRAERIVVIKGARRMQLWAQGRVIREYPVSLGFNPTGHKQRQGDGRTPEGVYTIEYRKPDSAFHRALRISYPGPADIARARALGVSPGGDIMIHGLPNGKGWIGTAHRGTDWTEGCIAVTNEEIEEIWRLVPVGTPIEIRS